MSDLTVFRELATKDNLRNVRAALGGESGVIYDGKETVCFSYTLQNLLWEEFHIVDSKWVIDGKNHFIVIRKWLTEDCMEFVFDMDGNLLRADDFSPKVAGEGRDFNEVIVTNGTILGQNQIDELVGNANWRS